MRPFPRRKRREERAKAAEYLQQGNRAAANDCYRKAVDITPRMAHKLIKVCASRLERCAQDLSLYDVSFCTGAASGRYRVHRCPI
jgi:Tfp pilus assembly protein PilF